MKAMFKAGQVPYSLVPDDCQPGSAQMPERVGVKHPEQRREVHHLERRRCCHEDEIGEA